MKLYDIKKNRLLKMIFTCPICEEVILTTKLCKDCEIIRQLTKIYSKERVIEVLEKVLIVKQFKPDEK